MKTIPAATIPLGKSAVLVSQMGVGTNAWGRSGRPRSGLKPIFDAALSRGISLFDTAEIYGSGGSEKSLGELLGSSFAGRERPVILSKFFPLPWRLRKGALIDALRRSLDRLELPSLDVYLLHFPWGPRSLVTWVEALADAVEQGLVRAVGVSNCNASQVRRSHQVLASRGIPLACNEVELSLARRVSETNGTLAACRALGVSVIAYRPLALGRLTGGPDRPAQGWRRLRAESVRTRDAVLGLLQKIGRAHDGKTPSQVALNWVLCKGAIPIPGATSISHLEENTGALGWRLTETEVSSLDAASSG